MSTDTKHTPGPWKVSRDTRTIFASTEGAGVLIRGVEQTIPQIAHVIGNGFAATLEEQKANARLIAAAPDLLSACRDVLEALDDRYDGAADSKYLWAGRHIDALRNAIANAESGVAGREGARL